MRIKVRVNGATTGALLKIGVEHDVTTDQELATEATDATHTGTRHASWSGFCAFGTAVMAGRREDTMK